MTNPLRHPHVPLLRRHHNHNQNQQHSHDGNSLASTSNTARIRKPCSVQIKRISLCVTMLGLAALVTRNARYLNHFVMQMSAPLEFNETTKAAVANFLNSIESIEARLQPIGVNNSTLTLNVHPSTTISDDTTTSTTTSNLGVDEHNILASNQSSSTINHDDRTDYSNNNTQVDGDDDNDYDALEIPQVMFDDFKYRRVCAHVHSSILCLILRFPFAVPLQDPSVTFPKPFHPHFDQLNSLVMVDGPLLEDCRKNETIDTATDGIDNQHHNHTNSSYLQTCLDNLAKQHPNPGKVVVALWTRRRARNHPQWNDERPQDSPVTLYGTGSEMQQQRIHDFFHSRVVFVLGSSTTAPITACLVELFGNACRREYKGMRYTCDKRAQERPQQRQRQKASTETKEDIVLSVHKYFPTMLENETIPGQLQHIINTTMPLMDMIRQTDIVTNRIDATNNGTSQLPLLPVSIVVDFPLAHTQTHYMMTEMADQVKYNQERLVEIIMNVTTSPIARQGWADMGLEIAPLAPLIVFDGLPQFFPTESGGYLPQIQRGNEQEFLKANGYPGWRPELGSSCRGPLPHNSPLRQVNDLERRAFLRHVNFQPQFYGKTFDFSNQFWWQTAKWWKKTGNYSYFDCVHTRKTKTGLSCVHKYVLQTMIDDHYETKAAAGVAAAT